MISTVQKWGNSQAIRIPRSIVEQLDLKENESVEIRAEGDMITIKKAYKHRTFAERMAGYTGDYSVSEMDTGEPVGKEIG